MLYFLEGHFNILIFSACFPSTFREIASSLSSNLLFSLLHTPISMFGVFSICFGMFHFRVFHQSPMILGCLSLFKSDQKSHLEGLCLSRACLLASTVWLFLRKSPKSLLLGLFVIAQIKFLSFCLEGINLEGRSAKHGCLQLWRPHHWPPRHCALDTLLFHSPKNVLPALCWGSEDLGIRVRSK